MEQELSQFYCDPKDDTQVEARQQSVCQLSWELRV